MRWAYPVYPKGKQENLTLEQLKRLRTGSRDAGIRREPPGHCLTLWRLIPSMLFRHCEHNGMLYKKLVGLSVPLQSAVTAFR